MDLTRPNAEKIAYQNVCSILDDPDLLEIAKEFGSEPFRRSSVVAGLDDVLACEELSGRVAYEIGTWCGLTAIVLARRFKRVVTYDIGRHPLLDDIMAFAKYRNLVEGEIEIVVAPKPELPPGTELAFLDGDHANRTKQDFEDVKTSRCVRFQDDWESQPGVWDLCNKIGANAVGHNFALWMGKWTK